jgi:hypothetical protein
MVNPFFIRCVEMKEKDIIYHAIGEIDKLCQKIINKENYMIEMPACIQTINQACEIILKYNNHSEEIIPILEDVMYGMTQRDEVFLLDVLRYGMKDKLEEIYDGLGMNEAENAYE